MIALDAAFFALCGNIRSQGGDPIKDPTLDLIGESCDEFFRTEYKLDLYYRFRESVHGAWTLLIQQKKDEE